MILTSFFTRTALATGVLLSGTTMLFADTPDDEIRVLRQQIQQLDQKLRVLERKQELKEEEAAVAAKAAPKVTINDKGVSLASNDNANSIKFRAVIQADSRSFFAHDGSPNNTTFLARKLRPILEGTFSKFIDYQIVPDFAGSGFTLLDASITVKLAPELQFKFGKFKTPVGLELLVSDPWLLFVERSLATNLVPNRDVGVQVGGDLWAGRLSYQVGVFNGISDGGVSTNADFDNNKDIAARLFAKPFVTDKDSLLQGLGFGVALTSGHQESAAALTTGYRTDGQQTFFRYRAAVVGSGSLWRISPQAYYFKGPFGLFAEYVESVANARPTATGARTELRHKAWEASASYVLTGEDTSYTAGVTPLKPFDLAAGTWGAWEVAARIGSLNIDDKAFPLFADPLTNATEAKSYGLGVNWYLTRTLKASVDYFQTDFKLPAASSTNTLLQQDEKVLITRVQLAF